jgi:hypothetical protein
LTPASRRITCTTPTQCLPGWGTWWTSG